MESQSQRNRMDNENGRVRASGDRTESFDVVCIGGGTAAVITGRPEGFIKLITRQRGRIGSATGGALLGAQIVGAGAGELIHEAVIAMQARTFTGRLAQAIHAYPSMSVGIQQTAAQLFAEGRRLAPVDDEPLPQPRSVAQGERPGVVVSGREQGR